MSTLSSKLHANSVLIVGHTTSGMGERVLAYKIDQLLTECGIKTLPIVDVIELLKERYEPLAKLNYALADGEHSLIEGLESFVFPKTDLLLVLSWCFGLAALFATDVHLERPTIAKLYAHHLNERILSALYKPADLLMTESLLANERGQKYGIETGKMLYFPHVYREMPPLSFKKEKRFVIGVVSRLEYGKNCEYALEAVRRVVERGKEVVLRLKGDFPQESPYPDFQPRFKHMLKAYEKEPWFEWDASHTAFPDVLEDYQEFDLLLHLSGAEGGSHVVVECLGLGIACVVLNCSTNPFLFRGLATFVKTAGEIRPAPLPFFVPDIEDVVQTLMQEINAPERARVAERFHPDVARERVPLLFERDKEKIAALYEKDCRLYGI